MTADDPRSSNPDWDRPATVGVETTPAESSVETQAPGGGAGPAHPAGNEHGPDLVGAVDALETVSTEPIHTHSARYHEVHTLLQDALSATDRPGS